MLQIDNIHDLKRYLCEKEKEGKKISSIVGVIGRNKNIDDLLKKETSFLDSIYENINSMTRVYCILKNIKSEDDIPFCKECGKNKVSISIPAHLGFNQTCGRECGTIYGSKKGKSALAVERAKTTRRNTMKQRYGVEYIGEIRESVEKARKTVIEKYGDYRTAYYDSASKTIEEKYGVKNISQSELYKNKIRQNMVDNHISKIEEELKLKCNSEYKSYYEPMDWVCLTCGNEMVLSYKQIYEGMGCKRCNNTVKRSRNEDELACYIESLGLKIEKNKRGLMSNKLYEVDIYIPEKGIAVEYNGLYWHSNLFLDKTYHLIKTEMCSANNIRLIQIFEDEWLQKKDIVESRLKQILNKTNESIYARNCCICEIDTKQKNSFLEKHHIQGKDKATIKLGLFYKDDLVSVMTFSKGNIAKGSKTKHGVWELNRFCSSTNVVGAAGKLLSYFKKNYEWKEIFSYADRRWSNGNLYEKLGFELIGETQVNYWYTDTINRIHRFNLRKKPNEPKDKTEFELRKEQGYTWIYDCGSLKYRMRSENEK